MLDGFARPFTAAPLQQAAVKISGAGFAPGHVTLLAFLFGFAGMMTAGMMAYIPALLLMLLCRGLLALANAMARTTGRSALGDYFARAADIVTFGGFVMFFGMGIGQGTGAAALLFAYVIYLALHSSHSALATRPSWHVANLVEGLEIALFIILVCLHPGAFSALAALLGVMFFFSALGHAWLTVRVMK